jgi:hypothetical protein
LIHESNTGIASSLQREVKEECRHVSQHILPGTREGLTQWYGRKPGSNISGKDFAYRSC